MDNITNNRSAPDLDLGTIYTAQDLNNPDITLYLKNPIYLMKYPYRDINIDAITFILFMSTLNEQDFTFKLKKGLNRKIGSITVDCRIMIAQKTYILSLIKKMQVKT